MSGTEAATARRALAPLLAALVLVAMFHLVGRHGADRFNLDLGQVVYLQPHYRRFLLYYAVFGTVIVGLVGPALARLAGSPGMDRLRAELDRLPDRRFLAYACALAFLLPATIRAVVLRGAPLTDDESAYRFTADLLLSGRLYAESPPLKLFFDRAFMINDGRYYSQYFVGWPALMAPFRLLGLSGYANSFYLAATVPGVYFTLRPQVGRRWARIGALLLLASPLLILGSATELSHTSCSCALAWTTAAVVRSRREKAATPWWVHAAVGGLFSVAFFVRPQSTIGLGLPLLLWWARGQRDVGDPRARAIAVLAFLVPAGLLAAAFLGVNWAQNGSPLAVSYQRYQHYVAENLYRFTHVLEVHDGKIANFDYRNVGKAVALNGEALTRIAFAMVGHPLLLLAPLLALGVRAARPWWAMVGVQWAVNFFLHDAGVDSIGPVHYTELWLPLVVLSVMGLRRTGLRLARLTAGSRDPDRRVLLAAPVAGLVACVLVCIACYLPVRMRNASRQAEAIELPRRALIEAGIDEAVVFVWRPYVPVCDALGNVRHSVFWWPVNGPDFDDPVVWANHLSVEDDRLLMSQFPGRDGYIMLIDSECEVAFIPVDELPPGSIPPQLEGGLQGQPDAEAIFADLVERGR